MSKGDAATPIVDCFSILVGVLNGNPIVMSLLGRRRKLNQHFKASFVCGGDSVADESEDTPRTSLNCEPSTILG